MKKKVIKHLKGDIAGYKKEINEDKELIHSLKTSGKKKTKAQKKKDYKRGGKKMKREIKKGKQEEKISDVLHEYKEGKLHSGSKKGPKVKSKKQAVAIALREAGVKRKNKTRRKKK